MLLSLLDSSPMFASSQITLFKLLMKRVKGAKKKWFF